MRKGALKVFDSTLNEWVKIPTLKGDKGDKGDPGVDADVAGCNTAIENANTATSNAIEATQDIKIVKDETQTIADYALEMGDYAKEQATTIDEKISGKADLYNYHPYEGEVKNGYWDANGNFISDSGYRAVEFYCNSFSAVFATFSDVTNVNRVIVYDSNNNIIRSIHYTKPEQLRTEFPKDAYICKLSTSRSLVGTIYLENKQSCQNGVIYRGDVNGIISSIDGMVIQNKNQHFTKREMYVDVDRIGKIPFGFSYILSIPVLSNRTTISFNALKGKRVSILANGTNYGINIMLDGIIVGSITANSHVPEFGGNGFWIITFDRILKKIIFQIGMYSEAVYQTDLDNEDFFKAVENDTFQMLVGKGSYNYVYSCAIVKYPVYKRSATSLLGGNIYLNPDRKYLLSKSNIYVENGDISSPHNMTKIRTEVDHTVFESITDTYCGFGRMTNGSFFMTRVQFDSDLTLKCHFTGYPVILITSSGCYDLTVQDVEIKANEDVTVLINGRDGDYGIAHFGKGSVPKGTKIKIFQSYYSYNPYHCIINASSCSDSAMLCIINGIVYRGSNIISDEEIVNIETTATSVPNAQSPFMGRLCSNGNGDVYIAVNSCLEKPTIWKKITP